MGESAEAGSPFLHDCGLVEARFRIIWNLCLRRINQIEMDKIKVQHFLQKCCTFYQSIILSERFQNTLAHLAVFQIFSYLDFRKDFILVILIDAQIPFCDMVSGMVINIHEYRRLYALFPRMVSEGLAQGMAADIAVKSCEGTCGFDDAVSLVAAQRPRLLQLATEQPGRGLLPGGSSVLLQSLADFPVHIDSVLFSCLLLRHYDMRLPFMIHKVIDIAIGQIQDIGNPQGGIQADYD